MQRNFKRGLSFLFMMIMEIDWFPNLIYFDFKKEKPMPRIFSDEPNKLTLRDNLSNSDIVLYYRQPTVKEVAAYTNNMTKRIRNKIVNRVGENRQEYGMSILTGFREGDFLIPKNQNGKTEKVPISSDPNSPHYDPNWKAQVQKYAADLIAALAIHVFEDTSDRDDDTFHEGDGVDLEADVVGDNPNPN